MRKLLFFAAVGLVVIASGCINDEKKKVHQFAEDFGNLVKKGDTRMIEKIYPDAEGAEIGFDSDVTDFNIDPKNSFGIWRIHYGTDSWIDVRPTAQGTFEIIDSEGILSKDKKKSKSEKSASKMSSESSDEIVKLRVSDVSDGPNGHLGGQAGNSYGASNLFDGKSSTGWAVTLADTSYDYDSYLYGPRFTVNGSDIDHIVIRNGYHKNSDSFKKNTRAAWIRIYRDNGGSPSSSDILYEGKLSDSMSAQTLQVKPSYRHHSGDRIAIAFSSADEDRYYHGSKWDDLVISELEFWGEK